MITLRSLVFETLFYVWSMVVAVLFLPTLILPRRIIVMGGEMWLRSVLWLLPSRGRLHESH